MANVFQILIPNLFFWLFFFKKVLSVCRLLVLSLPLSFDEPTLFLSRSSGHVLIEIVSFLSSLLCSPFSLLHYRFDHFSLSTYFFSVSSGQTTLTGVRFTFFIISLFCFVFCFLMGSSSLCSSARSPLLFALRFRLHTASCTFHFGSLDSLDSPDSPASCSATLARFDCRWFAMDFHTIRPHWRSTRFNVWSQLALDPAPFECKF